MEIYIVEELDTKKYKELINYALNKNNIMTFEIVNFERSNTKQKERDSKIIDSICEFIKEDKNNLIKKYKENKNEVLNKIFSNLKFKNDEYRECYEIQAKYSIAGVLENYSNEEKICIEKEQDVLKVLEKDIVKKESIGFIDRYYYKITAKEKDFLLKKNNLYDYEYPSPENLSLLNDEKLWLETVTHEKICTIHGNNEDEEFLNEIKVKYEKYLDKDYTVKIVKEEINKWDPVGLLKDRAVKNVYEVEIYSIVYKIQINSSFSEIANIIYKEFIEMFGMNIYGDMEKFKQECREVAKRIFLKL